MVKVESTVLLPYITSFIYNTSEVKKGQLGAETRRILFGCARWGGY